MKGLLWVCLAIGLACAPAKRWILAGETLDHVLLHFGGEWHACSKTTPRTEIAGRGRVGRGRRSPTQSGLHKRRLIRTSRDRQTIGPPPSGPAAPGTNHRSRCPHDPLEMPRDRDRTSAFRRSSPVWAARLPFRVLAGNVSPTPPRPGFSPRTF